MCICDVCLCTYHLLSVCVMLRMWKANHWLYRKYYVLVCPLYTVSFLSYQSYHILTVSVCYPIHTHTKPWGRLKWPYAITRLTVHCTWNLVSDLVICYAKVSDTIYDAKCPHLDLAPFKPQSWHPTVCCYCCCCCCYSTTIVHQLWGLTKLTRTIRCFFWNVQLIQESLKETW